MLTRQSGFTLIELMIVVIITAILVTIAYPLYTDQIRKSQRSDAKTTLMETAQRMERCFTIYNDYGECTDQVPNQSPEGYYDVSINEDSTTFTLSASPAANGPLAGDDCGDFTLKHNGERDVTGTLPADECW